MLNKWIQKTKFTPEQAGLFLRSRRSIRNYQNKPVPAELIRKVLNVARMVTATNTQGISYIVIRDKQSIAALLVDLVLLEWMHIAAKDSTDYASLCSCSSEQKMDKGKIYSPQCTSSWLPLDPKDIHRMIQSDYIYLMLNYMHRQ